MACMNQAGLDLIKRWEGLRLEAYKCDGDKWTIGYGHTATAKPGMTITEPEAENLLIRDISAAERAVERSVTVPLTDNQYSALVSWTFNLGAGALQSSTLLVVLNGGQYLLAPREITRWVKAGGYPLKGLVLRRLDEAQLFMKDD